MNFYRKTILLFFVFLSHLSWSQLITVNDSFSATDLVTTKLINSPCANVENFTSTGGTFPGSTNKSFGYFDASNGNFPFQNGILLTSSRAIKARGPNNGVLSEGTRAWLGDADLEAALGTNNTFNATVIEFDFTPLNSKFSFNYIFASEEYALNYPCIYSDGFAFLLKPVLGNQPYQNLAVIPNSATPVSSKSIHPLITYGSGCPASNETFFNGYNNNSSAINFNGQTVVMTAKADVISGQKYHIKLVIADQDDETYDSAIFIEGGSFNITADLGPNRTILAGNPVCGNEIILLNATIPGTNTYKWYKNNVLLPAETQPVLSASQTGIYKVQITVAGSTCIAESEVSLQFTPAFNLSAKTIKQCDTDLDLFTKVNLRQIESEISTNFADCTFKYYQNQTAANTSNTNFLIGDPSLYDNQNGNQVWVRVQNAFGCMAVIKIDLVISGTQLPPNYSQSLSKCDDFIDVVNNEKDGVSLFDFTAVSANLASIIPNPTNYQIKYYRSENDFNMETNAQGNNLAIQNIQNYRNTSSTFNQTIWIKVKSNLDSSCFGFGKLFLIVEKIPVAFAVSASIACDDNPADNIIEHTFDTSNIQNTVIGNQNPTDYIVTYFDENNILLPSPLPNPFTTKTQKIRIRITNKNGADANGKCWSETFLEFRVFAQPVANTMTVPAACADSKLAGQNAYHFDTSNFNTAILGMQQGMVIKFFDSNNNLINPLPNPFVSASQTIKAVVENPLNTSCSASTLIELVVNARPEVTAVSENFICSKDISSITISSGLTNANIAAFSYKWYLNNTLVIGATNETITVNVDGIYTCEITNIQSGCLSTTTNKVVFSEKPQSINLIINDLINNNSINAAATGSGIYEYSIDEPNGPFQSLGYFENISPGIHTLFVNDKNGCGTTPKTFAVVGIMPFFTPNGDSFNDFWKIQGINAIFNKKSKVQIFDRYGRFLTEILSSESNGWDGIFNGQPLPADDYWYTLTLEDGRVARGHFGLKR